MEARLRASPEQFGILIEFMESHGDVSRPQQGPQGRLRGDRLWAELTTLLNSVGGGVQRPVEKWKKVWADWKTKTKKKYLNIRKYAGGTGGGPSSRHSLTVLEERVVAIIGVSAVVGQSMIQEQGFIQSERVEMEIPSIPNSMPTPGPPLTPPLVLDVPDVTEDVPPPQSLAPPTPPNRGQRVRRRPASASPRSPATTPRRSLRRRNRQTTPFDRAVSEFVAVEQRRLQIEEERDRRHHEIELVRLRLEAERIEATQELNKVLQNLVTTNQIIINILSRNNNTSQHDFGV